MTLCDSGSTVSHCPLRVAASLIRWFRLASALTWGNLAVCQTATAPRAAGAWKSSACLGHLAAMESGSGSGITGSTLPMSGPSRN